MVKYGFQRNFSIFNLIFWTSKFPRCSRFFAICGATVAHVGLYLRLYLFLFFHGGGITRVGRGISDCFYGDFFIIKRYGSRF